jgi:hypothetical protein
VGLGDYLDAPSTFFMFYLWHVGFSFSRSFIFLHVIFLGLCSQIRDMVAVNRPRGDISGAVDGAFFNEIVHDGCIRECLVGSSIRFHLTLFACQHARLQPVYWYDQNYTGGVQATLDGEPPESSTWLLGLELNPGVASEALVAAEAYSRTLLDEATVSEERRELLAADVDVLAAGTMTAGTLETGIVGTRGCGNANGATPSRGILDSDVTKCYTSFASASVYGAVAGPNERGSAGLNSSGLPNIGSCGDDIDRNVHNANQEHDSDAGAGGAVLLTEEAYLQVLHQLEPAMFDSSGLSGQHF